MKTYTLEEAINYLRQHKNDTFESQYANNSACKYKLKISEMDTLVMYCHDGGMETCMPINKQWTLVRRPVSFMEAAEAFGKGKNVRCEYPGSIDGTKKTEIYKQGSGKGIMREESELTFYMINKGTWFVETEE